MVQCWGLMTFWFSSFVIVLSILNFVYGQDPQEIALNSERPAFYDASTSITGKIVLEEHNSTNVFQAAFTTPFYNNMNEIFYGQAAYIADVAGRLAASNISERVRQVDISNISVSVISLGPPGVQGIFNISFAIEAAAAIDDQLYAN